jgi:protein SCO1
MRKLLLASLLLLSGCGSGGKAPADLGIAPHFQFTNQNNVVFDSKVVLKQKLWIADFIFTNCPGACPRMGKQMQQIARVFADNPRIHFVSISVDPERDTPEVLRQYAKRFPANPLRWHYLTGEKAMIHQFMEAGMKLGAMGELTGHSNRFVLVDERMHIRGYYDPEEPVDMNQLKTDLRWLVSN